MTSLKIWARDGCWGAKLATSPRSTASAQHALRGLVGVDVEQGVAAVEVDDLDAGLGAQPAGIALRDELVAARGVLGAQGVARSGGADRAARDDHEVIAEALDDVELVRGEEDRGRPAAARSWSTPATTSTASGSRPENGSSRISTCGSCTSAAAICARCWLPSESVSTLSFSRSPSPSSSSSAVARAVASARSKPCSRAR